MTSDALGDATDRLVRTVDALGDDELRAASLLPGWTRAHVVAHLALNAEGLVGALDGIVRRRPVPIYTSDERRDGDIDELATASAEELRERLLAAVRRLGERLADLPAEVRAVALERTPGKPGFVVAEVPQVRRREVEIHHADLGLDYTAADWPPAFCAELLDDAVDDHAGSAESADFSVHATDLDRDWIGNAREPMVSGPAAALGWWLTGRGDGAGLSSSSGVLPRLGPWRHLPPTSAPTTDG